MTTGMGNKELRGIALRFMDKGYLDHGKLRDSDDLYSATSEDKDLCCEYLDEIQERGTKAFREAYGI